MYFQQTVFMWLGNNDKLQYLISNEVSLNFIPNPMQVFKKRSKEQKLDMAK
jgi:hypothetical protein